MKRLAGLGIGALWLAGMWGCASHQTVQSVRMPPRVDLKQHELIGVVEFSSTAEGELGPLATRRFTESARRDQGLVRMVSLGSRSEALRSVERDRWDSETFKALGREHGVRTILAGELTLSDIKPDIRISASMRSGRLSAQVDATLAVELIETSTGASMWSSSARATKTVGQIRVRGGRKFVFDADDPERAYGGLVDTLVEQTTWDFRASWERQ